MEQFIGCDAHKRYSVFVAVGEDGGCSPAWKVSHTEGAFEAFLEKLPEGSEIALEAKHSVINNCASLRDVLSWKHASANDCRLSKHHSGIAGRDPPIRGVPL